MNCYYLRPPGKAVMPASSSLTTAKVAMQQLEPQSAMLVLITLGCGYNRRRVGLSYSLSVRVAVSVEDRECNSGGSARLTETSRSHPDLIGANVSDLRSF